MQLYNTLSRRVENFKPINPGKVGIYSCGPTVYWNQHIGNMYAYVQWDVLVRVLRYLDFEVNWVMNITDVGHMTSDEDSGEDKMEKGAKREKLTVWEVAGKYINQFLQSADLLHITRPNVLCRATDHIQEQIELIKKIEANGFTYKTKTGIVFDTQKFKDYPKFARLNLSKQNAGTRVEVDPQKKNPWDFLLWVTNQPKHIMQWDSPWGRGFPGWHIECTAMSVKYLGETFDIHTGGKEHIPVHHTNEIAQAYGAFGRQTANYWLHNEWLLIDGKKISKSLGNTILVSDLQALGFSPEHLRYLFLTSHYRKGLNFTWEALAGAKTAYERLKALIYQWGEGKRTSLSPEKMDKMESLRQKFETSLNNDLNVPQALAVVWEVVKSNITDYDKRDLLLEWDQILGLGLGQAKAEEVITSPEIKSLVDKRKLLREQKKWSEADQVRKEIEKKGYILEDTEEGTKVKRKNF